jgi:hypothetical protein
MNEANAQAMITHFQNEVLGRLPKGPTGAPPIPVLAIPFLTPGQLADPIAQASQHRIGLINQTLAFADGTNARQRSINNAIEYLSNSGSDFLQVAQTELTAIDQWQSLVRSSQGDFDNRYRSEFLNGEGFRRFDEAKARLLDLLELQGSGRPVALVMWALRFPYRTIRDALGKALVRPNVGAGGEQQVLSNALVAWLDQLRAESIRRSETHALWKHVANGFSSGLGDTATQRFQSDFRNFQLSSSDEIEAAARAVTADVEKNPAALMLGRIIKLVIDLGAIGLAIWAGGLNWPTLIYIPLFVSATHQIAELIVRQYVEKRRGSIRNRKQTMVSETISRPMGQWLGQWPTSGGSAFEKMQTVLARLPGSIQQLKSLIATHQVK